MSADAVTITEPVTPLRERDAGRLCSKNAAWAMAGTLVVTAAGLAANVVLARNLSPVAFGTYALLFTSVSVLTIIARLGTDVGVVSALARARGRREWGAVRATLQRLVAIAVAGSAVVAVGWIASAHVLGKTVMRHATVGNLAPWVAGWIFFESLTYVFAEAFRGLGDIPRATAFGDAQRRMLLLVGFAVAFVFDPHPALRLVLEVTVVATGVATLISGVAIWRRARRLPAASAGARPVRSLRTSWPFVMVNASALVTTQGGVWILGAFASERAIASFGAAVRLVTLLALPLFVLNAVLAPELARAHAAGKLRDLEARIRRSVTSATVLAGLAVGVLGVFGGDVFGAILGDFYRRSAVLFVILAAGQLVNIASGVCGTALGMAGHQRLVALVDLVGALAFFTLAIAMEPITGAVGVAVASGIACAGRNAVLGALASRRLGIRTYTYFHPRQVATVCWNRLQLRNPVWTP